MVADPSGTHLLFTPELVATPAWSHCAGSPQKPPGAPGRNALAPWSRSFCSDGKVSLTRALSMGSSRGAAP